MVFVEENGEGILLSGTYSCTLLKLRENVSLLR